MSGNLEETLRADLVHVLAHVDLAPLAGRHLFLTGCTGFVGAWLLRAIAVLNDASLGIRATVLTRDVASFSRRQPRLAQMPWLRLLAGDVTSQGFDSGPVDLVVHGAAAVRPEALRDTYTVMSDLTRGTQRILDHAASAGAERILLLSSGAVYGPLPSAESAYAEHLPCIVYPTDAYACGKVGMEALALAHGRSRELPAVIARMFAFVGPWLPGHLAVAQILRMVAEDEAVTLNSDGSPVRSFLYGADMAVWLLTLLAHGEDGLICNVGSDDALELAALADMATDLLAPAKPVRSGSAKPDAPRSRYVPDIGLARSRFGLAPWTPLPTALSRHFAWLTASGYGDARQ